MSDAKSLMIQNTYNLPQTSNQGRGFSDLGLYGIHPYIPRDSDSDPPTPSENTLHKVIFNIK
eukprot:7382162-Ditylum_brightwellii.AAC.1